LGRPSRAKLRLLRVVPDDEERLLCPRLEAMLGSGPLDALPLPATSHARKARRAADVLMSAHARSLPSHPLTRRSALVGGAALLVTARARAQASVDPLFRIERSKNANI